MIKYKVENKQNESGGSNDYNKIGNYNKQANNLIYKGLSFEKEGEYWDAIECYELALEKDLTSSNFVNALINNIRVNLQSDFIYDEMVIDNTEICPLKRNISEILLKDENPEIVLNLYYFSLYNHILIACNLDHILYNYNYFHIMINYYH